MSSDDQHIFPSGHEQRADTRHQLSVDDLEEQNGVVAGVKPLKAQ